MITNILLNKVVNDVNNYLTHISLGTGTEPNQTDTQLNGETIRKIADSYIDENTIIKELFLDESEGNDIQFTSVGLFGLGSTEQIGTGTLLSGGRMPILKTSNQSMTVSVEITIERM